MRKEDFLSIIVYLLMLIVALFIGYQLIQPALEALELHDDVARYGFAIGTIIIGVFVNVILFELGHVIGAILGGYQVISVNVLGLAYYKTKEGWKFGLRRFEGLTGETKIIAKKEVTRPRLFLFGPTILTIFEFVVALILFLAFDESVAIHHQALIVAGIGTMLLLYNIMPFKMDNFTDGYYIVLLGKKINVEAYNELIRIESQIFANEEIGEVKSFEEITTMTARVSMYKIDQLMDAKNYKEALALIDKLVEGESTVEHEFIGRIKAQKLYIYLQTIATEGVSNYWFKELNAADRKFISNDQTLPTMRAYFLYSGLVTKSESECAFVLKNLSKAVKYRLNDYRFEDEKAMFLEAYAKVKEANPEWSLLDPTF